jgi:hypothetical protein
MNGRRYWLIRQAPAKYLTHVKKQLMITYAFREFPELDESRALAVFQPGAKKSFPGFPGVGGVF